MAEHIYTIEEVEIRKVLSDCAFLDSGSITFDALSALEGDDWDEQVCIWMPFENYSREEVLDMIQDNIEQSRSAALAEASAKYTVNQIVARGLGFEGDPDDMDARDEHIIDLAFSGAYEDYNDLVDLIETAIILARQ